MGDGSTGQQQLDTGVLAINSGRIMEQNKQAIQVIIGNPPYSAGQNNANDNNQNTAYPALDQRIMDTYVARSSATNKNALYDSYIRAMRWASDRIGERGIIGFVTNAGFVDSNSANGLRLCLAQEFSSIYILHLRGNQRTAGELSRQEGGKIFGSGSRAPIAISLLVKNPAAPAPGQIYIYDIGDNLTREEKLAKLVAWEHLAGIDWQRIQPDSYGDWLQQRDQGFERFMPLGAKKQLTAQPIFANYSMGVNTARDAWCYNADKVAVAANMQRML
ncbi:damage-inducible protein, partial [Achromatium sp. WMS2]